MSERRRHPRFSVEGIDGRVVCPSPIDVVNMSISGAALTVDRRLAVGGDYTLRLDLGNRVAAVQGKVVWSVLTEIVSNESGEDQPQYSAGVKFTDVLTPRIQELLSFIDEHKIVKEQRLTGLRLHVDAPGKAVIEFPEACRVLVLSLSGMSVAAERPLPVSRECPVEIDLPDGAPVACIGRVVSCAETLVGESRGYEAAMDFKGLSGPDRDRLSKFLDTL